jgi:hypothetical protein
MRMTAFTMNVEIETRESRPGFDRDELLYLTGVASDAVRKALTEEFASAEQPEDRVKVTTVHIDFICRWET